MARRCVQLRAASLTSQYLAAKFAASFRRFLWRQHLGLIKPQPCPGPVTDAMRMIGTPNVYDWDSPEDQRVADPLSPDVDRLLNETAKTNEEALETVFHCVPSDKVRSKVPSGGLTPRRSKRGRTTRAGCPSRRSRRVTSLCRTWTSIRLSRRSRGVCRSQGGKWVLTGAVHGSLVPYPKDFLCECNLVCRVSAPRTDVCRLS